MKKVKIEKTDSGLKLSGHLTFPELSFLKRQGLDLLDRLSHCKVDCRDLLVINSVGLALFLSWLRYAKKRGKTLVFSSVSEQMKMMASLYSLDAVLIFED